MKRILLITLAVALLAADVIFYLVTRQTETAGGVALAAANANLSTSQNTGILTTGTVMPVRHVTLSTPVIGRVDEILVYEGELVQEGQLLIRLDNRGEAVEVSQAEAALRGARAKLAKLQAGAHPQEIIAAQAAVEIAQANLAKITDTTPQVAVPAIDQSVSQTIAEAELRQAEAHLALLNDPRAEDIEMAQAEIDQAAAVLHEKQLALEGTEFRAPFAGVIATLNLEVGEDLKIGDSLVEIADLNDWQIEGYELDEMSIVHIAVGDKVTIRFDAIPGLKIPGTLVHIGPSGNYDDGRVSYSIVIKPGGGDPRVRWHMTAEIEFAVPL